jgi:hypothetical protein
MTTPQGHEACEDIVLAQIDINVVTFFVSWKRIYAPVALPRLAVTIATDPHSLGLATARELGLATGVLDSEDTALDRVDKDVLRLEVRVVAPCAKEFDSLREMSASWPRKDVATALLTPSSSGWTSKKPVSSMLWPAGS